MSLHIVVKCFFKVNNGDSETTFIVGIIMSLLTYLTKKYL